MINIYPSKLDGAPLESYRLKQPDSIHGWLVKNVSNYEVRDVPPVSIAVNGQLVPPDEWGTTVIRPLDTVDIYPEAKADWVLYVYIAIAVISALSAIYVVATMPKLNSSNGAATKGDALDTASARGNKVKLNSIIREIAGTFKVYPDYLIPPHSYFINDTEQWVELLLCVGKGSYTIPVETVLIGDLGIIEVIPEPNHLGRLVVFLNLRGE